MHRSVVPLIVALLLVSAACAGEDAYDTAGTSGDGTTSPKGEVDSGCGRGADVASGAERLQLESGGLARDYERVVPSSYDGTTPLPLILSLHGFTSSIEQQNLFSNLPQAAAARGYIVLTPQAAPATLSIGGENLSAPFWNVTPAESSTIPDAQDDVAFLTELLDSTMTQLCVDEARLYVTGNSNGAGMSATLACALPGRLAAIAPVSGINLAGNCNQLDPVSVIAFHGDADPLVPYAGGAAANVGLDNPSVQERVAEFAQAAGCAPEPELTMPFTDIRFDRWTGCQPGLGVELYTVVGGGHTWPGMLNYVDATRLAELASNQRLVELADVDLAAVAGHMTINLEATRAMLDFFDSHQRP